MEEISWTDRVKNKQVLQGVKGETKILCTKTQGRPTGLITSCVRTVF